MQRQGCGGARRFRRQRHMGRDVRGHRATCRYKSGARCGHSPAPALLSLATLIPLVAHVLVHRFIQAGAAGGSRPGGPPLPPPPCDDKLMRALGLLHVPSTLSSSSSSAAAAAAAKLLALLPPPVRIERGECARLLLQLQVRANQQRRCLQMRCSLRSTNSRVFISRAITAQHAHHSRRSWQRNRWRSPTTSFPHPSHPAQAPR